MSRIELRRVRSGDAADLIAANQANQLPSALGRVIDGPGGFRRLVRAHTHRTERGLLARERASGRLVGVVNINEIVAGAFLSAYLGYYGMSEFRGSGMMGEAPARHGRAGVRRTRAASPGSERAARQYGILALLRRAGFRKEGFSPRYLRIDGQWRDHERWACCWTTTLRQLAQKGWPAGRAGVARLPDVSPRRRGAG